jgi:hypothetical protein
LSSRCGPLPRVWLVALCVALGTAWGERWETASGVVGIALGVLLLSLRRLPAAHLAGLVVGAVALGGLAASTRSSGGDALAGLASMVPRCDIEGSILEHSGGLGTLVAVDQAACTGYGPVRRPGRVWLDGSIGYSGSPVRAHGWLLPLGEQGFDSARPPRGRDRGA